MDIHQARHDHQALAIHHLISWAFIMPADKTQHTISEGHIGIGQIGMRFFRCIPGDNQISLTDQGCWHGVTLPLRVIRRPSSRHAGRARQVSARKPNIKALVQRQEFHRTPAKGIITRHRA